LCSHLLSETVKIKIHKTIILPVVLLCGTWYLTLKEGCRLKIFENRVLRRISELKRCDTIGGWRKLHEKKIHNFLPHAKHDIIRAIMTRTRDGQGISMHGREDE
jgi:hypothetical protein